MLQKKYMVMYKVAKTIGEAKQSRNGRRGAGFTVTEASQCYAKKCHAFAGQTKCTKHFDMLLNPKDKMRISNALCKKKFKKKTLTK